MWTREWINYLAGKLYFPWTSHEISSKMPWKSHYNHNHLKIPMKSDKSHEIPVRWPHGSQGWWYLRRANPNAVDPGDPGPSNESLVKQVKQARPGWRSLKKLDNHDNMIEGSLEVKLPTIWTDEKQSREEAERRERLEEIRVEEKE